MPSGLKAGAGSGDVELALVGGWVCVGAGVLTLFRLNAPILRSAFWDAFSQGRRGPA